MRLGISNTDDARAIRSGLYIESGTGMNMTSCAQVQVSPIDRTLDLYCWMTGRSHWRSFSNKWHVPQDDYDVIYQLFRRFGLLLLQTLPLNCLSRENSTWHRFSPRRHRWLQRRKIGSTSQSSGISQNHWFQVNFFKFCLTTVDFSLICYHCTFWSQSGFGKSGEIKAVLFPAFRVYVKAWELVRCGEMTLRMQCLSAVVIRTTHRHADCPLVEIDCRLP